MEQGTVRRLSRRPGEADVPRVEYVDGMWRIRSASAVRQVLRERDATTQAGFNAESIPDGAMANRPVLFMDGEAHRRQRSKIARFFAPRTVATRYRRPSEELADRLVARAVTVGEVRLDELSLLYSTQVAALVLGLTNSPIRPMARRIERLLDQPVYRPDGVGEGRVRSLARLIRGHAPMVWFYLRDVRPAIRARRKVPEEDVISHLLAEGYSTPAILIECVTFGAAGMATTRELIAMAAWHLLRDDDLRARYLGSSEEERHTILQEVLRLEPIIGHLYRRAQRHLTVMDGTQSHTIEPGELIDLFIRQANADPATVGSQPLDLCPGRALPKGIGAEVMSFGDGPHKCPGNALAIQETDILLQRLLRRSVRVVREPRLDWDDVVAGYNLRDFVLAVS